jgi:YD repeat-containing protein
MTRGTSGAAIEKIDYTYDATTGKKATEIVSAFQNNTWVTTKSETYAHTSDGNLRSVTHSDGSSIVNSYLPDGTLSSVQDEKHTSANTSYSYDGANRMVSVTQTLASASGGQIVTRYAYDLAGNLTSVTDPNGNVTTYVFDDFGRMQRQNSPVSGTTSYAYDLAGNLLTTTDANSAATTRVYDSLNRATSSSTSRASASESVTSTYDDPTAGNFGLGRLATITDPSGSTVYQYDRRGMLRSEAKSINGTVYTTTYTYDANGNRSTMAYPSGLVARYISDFADRPYSLTAGSTAIVSAASYLPFGPLLSLTLGNGTTRAVTYDARYRPTENKFIGSEGTIADYTYVEDNAGNITQIHDATDSRFNRDFGYDDLNRLTTANSGTSLWGNGAYTYDAMGNMLSSTLGSWKTTSSTFAGTTPKLNSISENGVSRSVIYDAAGNEEAAGSTGFAYSPRNLLAASDTAAYLYDSRGVLTAGSASSVLANTLEVSITPSSVAGGTAATGTVTLTTPAAATTTISLSSNNTAVATTPPNVTVPAGATTATFTINTYPAAAGSPATITAAYNQSTATALLYVQSPQLAAVSVSPSRVTGGNNAAGTVTLTGTTAASIVVQLSSNNANATVPASVTYSLYSRSIWMTVSVLIMRATRTISCREHCRPWRVAGDLR